MDKLKSALSVLNGLYSSGTLFLSKYVLFRILFMSASVIIVVCYFFLFFSLIRLAQQIGDKLFEKILHKIK